MGWVVSAEIARLWSGSGDGSRLAEALSVALLLSNELNELNCQNLEAEAPLLLVLL